jgi:SAM-dependent methyltransferase
MTKDAQHRTDQPRYFGKDLEAMSFARNYHEWILAGLRPWLAGQVAEVGAGVGSFSRLLLGCGIDSLAAYEPSQNMFPVLRDALQGYPQATAVNGFFGHAGEHERFDSIVYVNVLEHVEDDDAELQRVHTALRRGGHVLIFVPALMWLYSRLDRQVGHFRRYHTGPLQELVARCGLSVIKARYFDLAGVLPWYVNFVLLRNEIGAVGVALYDKAVVPVSRVLENLVSPPLGKNLLLVARKD